MTSQGSETEVLSANECWKLLRSTSVGRLALWVDDHPDIFPVNYAVDHGTVVFRTAEGTKATAALGEVPVALEADGVSTHDGQQAWSVVIKGRAETVQRTDELLKTIALPIHPWQSGRKDRLVRIVPEVVTGRRFPIAAPVTEFGIIPSHSAEE